MNLTQEQRDALKEIVTVGAGNAATALSQMLKKRINIEVPTVTLTTIDKASDVFGDAESLVITIYLQLLGDAQGVIMFTFNKDEAIRLSDLLLGRPQGKTKILTEMAESSLKETATILSGAYLSAMAKLLKMRFIISSPGLAQDMAGAIVDNILIETSKEADHAIVVNTELKIIDEKVMAYFFFVPDTPSLKKIMDVTGVK